MIRPMFPHTFDSTIVAAIRSCQYKGYLQYMEHWKPKAESVHLVAGGAFAKGIEVARKAYFERIAIFPTVTYTLDALGQNIRKVTWTETPFDGEREDAEALGVAALIATYGDFECPSDSAKSLERTAGALEYYFSQYPLGADGLDPVKFANGKSAIEFSFALPLPVNHPVTGDPILYTGRCDMIGDFAGGRYVVDEKTTTSLGASWPRQWEMRSQFTGYIWAAREYGIEAAGAMVRGVSILKTKYDTMPAITYRGQHEIDRWLEQTCRDIERLKRSWEEGFYDMNLDHSCAEYGGCGFVQVCKSPDPDTWLPMYFEKRVWDPLARKELTVAEWERSWGHEPDGLATSGSVEDAASVMESISFADATRGM